MGIKIFRHKGNPHEYKTRQAQRKPPMGIKLGKHSGNPPWVCKFSGKKENPMGIKIFRHKGNPHGYKTRQAQRKPPWV